MKNFIKNFVADEAGASAAEYALIIAVVGVGLGAAAFVLGQNVSYAVGEAAEDVGSCANPTGAFPSSAITTVTGTEC